MPKMNYLEMFKNAFKLSWRNRYLWWFGFFIALAEIFTSLRYSFDEEEVELSTFLSWTASYGLSPVTIALIALAFFVAITLVSTVIEAFGRGALIQGTNEEIEGRRMNFKSSAKAGRKYFWKIFLLTILLKLFNFLAILILFTPVAFLFITKSYSIGALLGMTALIIFLPLVFITSFLRIFGHFYIILGKLSIWSAMENSYNLLMKNFRPTLLTMIFLLLLKMLVAVSIITSLFLIAIILIVPGIILFLLLQEIGIIIVAIIVGIIFMLLVFVVKSMYVVFVQTIWLMFFRTVAKEDKAEGVTALETESAKITPASPLENI